MGCVPIHRGCHLEGLEYDSEQSHHANDLNRQTIQYISIELRVSHRHGIKFFVSIFSAYRRILLESTSTDSALPS